MKSRSVSGRERVRREYTLLAVLFPRVRAEMLRLLFSEPQKQRYVRELVAMSGLGLCTVQDELRKLSAIGLVSSWSNRYRRFYRANTSHPLVPELVRIVQLSARLPRTKHSALHRQRQAVGPRRVRRRSPAIAPDRVPKGHLFSRSKKT